MGSESQDNEAATPVPLMEHHCASGVGVTPSRPSLGVPMTLSLLVMLAAPSFAAEVDVVKTTATSTFPPEAGAMYMAALTKDRKLGTSWVEGSGGAGLGQSITLELAGENLVKEIHVWAGMWYSTEFWERANRPREVEVKLSDGTKMLCAMKDEMLVQVCAFDEPTKSTTVQLTLKGAFSGTTWTDTAISEIKVFDGGPPVWKKFAEASASTELADDGDGPYTAMQAGDGMSDSMWCEGNKEGDGVGEWLQLNLEGTQKITELELFNGIASSMTVYKKGNRPLKATLSFSDGSTKSVEFKDSHRKQTIPLGMKSTSFIKIQADSVATGTAYNDMCISSVRVK